jgi:hypothetical protein
VYDVGVRGKRGRGGVGGIRIHARAKSSFPLLAVPTSTIGDVERHYYSISLLEEGNSRAGFDYDSHVFVAWFASAIILSLIFGTFVLK